MAMRALVALAAVLAPPACGDGVINQDSESCDSADLGGATCQDVGFLGGTLACNGDCTFDATGCEGVPFCGNGEINRDVEECDGVDLGGLTCEGLGLGGGTLGCSTTCTVQTAGCLGSGATDPDSITLEPSSPVCMGGPETIPVSINFPPTSVVDKVDIFLYCDDTGSFAGRVPSVRNIFSQLVDELQIALPDISFAFGVGRFENYGGPGSLGGVGWRSGALRPCRGCAFDRHRCWRCHRPHERLALLELGRLVAFRLRR